MARERGGDGPGGEIVGPRGGERPAVAADRGARGVADERLTHGLRMIRGRRTGLHPVQYRRPAARAYLPAGAGVRHYGAHDRPAALRDLYLRSEEHTSELQSRLHLVCRLLLEKK